MVEVCLVKRYEPSFLRALDIKLLTRKRKARESCTEFTERMIRAITRANEWFRRLRREEISENRMVRAIYHHMNHQAWKQVMMTSSLRPEDLSLDDVRRQANNIDSFQAGEESSSGDEMTTTVNRVQWSREDRNVQGKGLTANFNEHFEDLEMQRAVNFVSHAHELERDLEETVEDLEGHWDDYIMNQIRCYYVGQGRNLRDKHLRSKRKLFKVLPGDPVSPKNIVSWKMVFGRGPDGEEIDRESIVVPSSP